MAMHEYRRVIAQICSASGLDEARLLEDGYLCAGDTMARLEYFSPADLCRVQVDLGRPPASDETGTLRWMLECNAESSMACLPVLAIDPNSGNALIYLHFPLVQRDAGEALLRFLQFEIGELLDKWIQVCSRTNAEAASDPDTDLLTFA